MLCVHLIVKCACLLSMYERVCVIVLHNIAVVCVKRVYSSVLYVHDM